jgi:hypothetical protein
MNNLLYTDFCSDYNIIQSIDSKVWTLNDSLNIIMLPEIKIAVINVINEISVIEMGLLHFMCRPILITSLSISNYPILQNKIIDFTSHSSDLRSNTSTFIDWYKSWEK